MVYLKEYYELKNCLLFYLVHNVACVLGFFFFSFEENELY